MTDTMPTHDELEPAADPRTISRRRLLKALAASGLAVAGSSLPADWFSPEVEMGVLPAHAQVSPVPPYSLVSCAVAPVEQSPDDPIYATTYIWCSCVITPPDAGVAMRLTITLNDPQHPLHGQLLLDVTDDTGISGTVGAELDLGGVVPPVTPGDDRLEVLWEFDDPTVGSGTCLTLVDIQVRPS